MTETFDVVVAGAGHNSLVAAAYLASAGLRCVVLEARPDIGGDTSSAELTVPGFRHDSCSTAHNLIQGSPIIRDDELGLAGHGLEYLHPDPVVHVPFPDGAWLTMWRDEDRTAAEFARFSARDAAAYRRMMAEYAQIAPVLTRRRYTPAACGEPASRALAGQPGGERWLRADAMSAWEVIRAEFEDEHVRAFMLSHNWHGSCHGGEAGPAPSGATWPAARWAGHRTPIPGLYQTGATTYPGGSVSGAPGRNAAAVVLADLGSSLAAAIAANRG